MILDKAIRYQTAVFYELKAEKSADRCRALQAHRNAIHVELYKTLQRAAMLSDCECEFRAAIIAAGYDLRPDIVGPPFISAPLVLGSERQHDSQISTWRRHLQDKGILP